MGGTRSEGETALGEAVRAPSADGAAGALTPLQRDLCALVARVQRVDLRDFETASADAIWRDLVPVVVAAVADARALIGRVLEACDAVREAQPTPRDTGNASSAFLPFDVAIDEAVRTGEGSLQAVDDIGFLVHLELRQRAERLERLSAGHGQLTLIGEADGGLRRIRKGLAALDAAIASATGAAATLDFATELRTSLVVRRAYARFRQRLTAGGEPAAGELRARLRGVGTQIAVLVGWQAYPLLRVRDRLQLRELQGRILGWLRTDASDDALTGLRLWQDVVAFVEMLAQVNRRQELVEHDTALVVTALAALRGAPPPDGEAGALLAPLEGLDDELDRLLAADAPTADALRGALERLGARLGVAGAGAAR